MAEPQTAVILGGTTEARQLANQLVETHGEALRVITSLAGRTAQPRLPKGEVRTGGFGGTAGLAQYLTDIDADILIDATHPYAAQISAHAVDATQQTATPHLMLVRPAWTESKGDRWIHVPDIREGVAEISRRSDACLITTGINDLEAFAPIVTTKLFVRLIEDPREPLALRDVDVIIGKPPYKKAEEVALFRLLGIDLMISKNAGGDGTSAKIEAARDLGIEVIMVDRPPMPACETVPSVDDALTHIRQVLKIS